MRVGIVTTCNERCGLAAYSENIMKHLPQVDWLVIDRAMWGDNFSNVPKLGAGCDLVHIMHHGGLMASMSPEIVKACGKTVITRQCIGDESVFNAATIKTAHVRAAGYRWVPHGIPVVGKEVLDQRLRDDAWIGCCGIPFDGKGHNELVNIARQAGAGVAMVIPDSPHTSSAVAKAYEELCEFLRVPWIFLRGWPTEEQVSIFLSGNIVNVFYYTRLANGISGAVRMGLAARRPVIVSRHSQFQDIIEAGAVTVADSLEHAAELVRNPGALVRPDALVDAWGYDKTAMMYYRLYEEVLGG